jgi:hypothetical protein
MNRSTTVLDAETSGHCNNDIGRVHCQHHSTRPLEPLAGGSTGHEEQNRASALLLAPGPVAALQLFAGHRSNSPQKSEIWDAEYRERYILDCQDHCIQLPN